MIKLHNPSTFIIHYRAAVCIKQAAALFILGLRRSEIVGLTWDNVDFENRLIHIRQAVIVGDSSILTPGTYKVIGRTGSKRNRGISY